jgi:DNA-directed RNA polymerase specialized sigma24 family protein
MNSVALTAPVAAPVLGAESDLIRLAATGDSQAFEELYRRHSPTAWGFAQAVALDEESATMAVAYGFAKAGHGHRRSLSPDSDDWYRPQLLAAIYQRAGQGPVPHARQSATVAEVAFRSLPERWRAAIWLSEVESMDSARIAEVLGVSSAMATQLVHRGSTGLAARCTEAHRTWPEPIGPVLRSLAAPIPANLAEVTKARRAAGPDRQPLLAPITGWLEERAVRPLTVSVGALLALGVISIGVLAPNDTLRSNLGGTANNPTGADTCYGVPCAAGAGPVAASTYTGFNLTGMSTTGLP